MLNKVVRKSQGGFTLVELMITVVVISLLAMFAIPAYNDSVAKGRRADAKSTLTALAAKQGQYFMDNKTYTATLSDLAASSTSIDGHYTISAVATATTFTLTATPASSDPKCANFTLTESGEQGVSGDNSANPELCW